MSGRAYGASGLPGTKGEVAMVAPEKTGGRSDVLRPRSCRVTENTLGILLAGGEGRRLLPLTASQAKPALPFAGEHRLIDFTLSNCLHSGLRRVIVVTCHQARSVHPHLGALAPFGQRGLELETLWLPPELPGDPNRGTAGAVRALLDRVLALKPRQVLILAADHVYRMDYGPLLRFHALSGGPATVVATQVDLDSARCFGVMSLRPDGRVGHFEEKPASPSPLPGNPQAAMVSMGLYVFDTDELVRALTCDAADPESSHDLGTDVMPRLADRGKLRTYLFQSDDSGHPGFWRDVGTLGAFFRAAMEMLGAPGDRLLRDPCWPLVGGRSSRGPECRPPAATPGADIDSCLLPRDCSIGACSLSRSVLSTGASVAAEALVENSILLPGAGIGKGAKVRGCIVGQGAQVPAGAEVGAGASPEVTDGSFWPTVVMRESGNAGQHGEDGLRASFFAAAVPGPLLAVSGNPRLASA